MTFGEKLKQLRVNRDLSQEDLASILGTSKQVISRYESGQRSPKIDTATRYAELLDIPVCYLVDNSITSLDELCLDNPYFQTAVISHKEYTMLHFPVLGNIAASFDHHPDDYFTDDYVDVPSSYLRGRNKEDFFALRVDGDSMYPIYLNGDIILCLRSATIESDGIVAAVIYNSSYASLKKVVKTETGVSLVPINPMYQATEISGADLEQFHIQGIPKLVIRRL